MLDNTRNTRNKAAKSFSILGFIISLVIVVTGIIALVKSPGAYLDNDCGNVYEWCITCVTIISISNIIMALFNLCGVEDKTLKGLCAIASLCCVIWILVNFNNKYDNTCRHVYRTKYNFMYWYYNIMLYVSIVSLSLLCLACCCVCVGSVLGVRNKN